MKNARKSLVANTLKVRNFIILIVIILGFNIDAFAQNYFIIGTGTHATHLYPMDRGQDYSTHEVIYLQTELGGPNVFTKISFHKMAGTNVDGIENVTIYMKHTTDSTLDDGSYNLSSGYIEVFDGTFTNNAPDGWMEVTLTNGGFSYNGVDNLQVLIIKGYQSSIPQKPQWNYTELSDYKARSESNNSSQPTYLRSHKKRPNIKIEYSAPTFLWVEIGTGTDAQAKSPINRKYDYSTSELIYLDSEIGRGYYLNGIAFYKKEGTNMEGIENVAIYLKNSTDSNFTDGTYSLTGYTEVYNGTFTNNATSGWMEVMFTIGGFSYHCDGHLHVLIIKSYQNKTSHEPEWSYTEVGDNRARNGQDNKTQPTMLEASNELPNVRLIYDHPNPVELTSFTSSIKDRNVTLNWSTTVELNNAGFEVERKSVNDAQWTRIGFVEGNGTTNEPMKYTFTDVKLETGKYNYRLKQIDYNNSSTVYDLNNAIEIGIPKKPELSQNYPNPFNPVTKIDYNLPYNGNVSLKIYDITGREIVTLVNETQTAGYYTVQFDASNFASGTYFYTITTDDGVNNYVMTKRMILIK